MHSSYGGGVQTIPLVKQRLQNSQNVWNSKVSHIFHLPKQIKGSLCAHVFKSGGHYFWQTKGMKGSIFHLTFLTFSHNRYNMILSNTILCYHLSMSKLYTHISCILWLFVKPVSHLMWKAECFLVNQFLSCLGVHMALKMSKPFQDYFWECLKKNRNPRPKPAPFNSTIILIALSLYLRQSQLKYTHVPFVRWWKMFMLLKSGIWSSSRQHFSQSR